MKITLTFTTPNVIEDAFDRHPELCDIEVDEQISDAEKDKIFGAAANGIKEFVQNRQTVKIEFDTILGTATVLPADPALEVEPTPQPLPEEPNRLDAFAMLNAALHGY